MANRVRIQNLGATTFIVIADYQVLTDRDTADAVGANVHEAILDYLASGLDPENGRTFFFSHSHVPELNQLLLPFMSLVTTAELDRNPTVKEEIRAAGLRQVNALMYTYAIHQAADILFCKGNVVPVGRDQLPHLELTRKIARRFNERFSPTAPVFPVPDALLSDLPVVLGTDGQKMSKSRGNTIMLKMTADETARAIKGAKTDADRHIAYAPQNRPEVANLLRLVAICTGESPEAIAERIGDGGGGKLKALLTEALNAYLAPIRERRARYAAGPRVCPTCVAQGRRAGPRRGHRHAQTGAQGHEHGPRSRLTFHLAVDGSHRRGPYFGRAKYARNTPREFAKAWLTARRRCAGAVE